MTKDTIDFCDEEDTKELRSILDELLDVDSGLTDWETDFLDSVSKWAGKLTRKQGVTIEKIYKRVLG